MAGTGHKYEISNPRAVSHFIYGFLGEAASRDLDKATEWLRTKHFLKYVTGPRFTYALKPTHILKTVDEEEKSTELLSRLLDGREVRRFAPYLFETLGPDIHHILDWIADLKETGDKAYAKVARMDTEVMVAKAAAWTNALAKKAAEPEGQNELVLAIDNELSWYELKDERSLRYEGEQMAHCVGSSVYTSKINRGEARIFSLRKDVSKPLLTVEIETSHGRNALQQVQKHGNGGLPISLCDMVVDLLAQLHATDELDRGKSYGLVAKNRAWSTVYDSWEQVDLAGRKVLSDGKRFLFFCATDTSKPLLVAEKWSHNLQDGAEYFSFRDATAVPPHYDDQIEACDIVNTVLKTFHVASVSAQWIRTLTDEMDNKRVAPEIDTLERVYLDANIFFYKRTLPLDAPEYLLPHANDRARILMATSQSDDTRSVYAHVSPGQRIARSQIDRCLAFMNKLQVRFLGKPGLGATDEPTRDFMHEFKPVRVSDTIGWKAFALDCREEESKLESAKWLVSDYLLRFSIDFGSSDFFVDGRKLLGWNGAVLRRDALVEVTRLLNRKRIGYDQVIWMENWRPEGLDTLLFKLNGKWTFVDTARKFKAVAATALSLGNKAPSSLLDALLTYCRMLMNPSKSSIVSIPLDDTRNALLVAWLQSVTDFSKYPVPAAGYMAFRPRRHYGLLERATDLGEAGYTPATKKEVATIRKLFGAIVSYLGRGKIRYPHDTEFSGFVVRWWKHLPKRTINKASPYDIREAFRKCYGSASSEYLAILNDPELYRTSLRDGVRMAADKMLKEAEYTGIATDVIASHARLYARLSKDRHLYSDHLDCLKRLLDAFVPTTADDEEVRCRLVELSHKYTEEEKKIQAYYAARKEAEAGPLFMQATARIA